MSRHQKLVNSRNQPLGVEADATPREERGRTTAPQTPVSIHAAGVELPTALSAYVHKKLGVKLGAFALAVDRVAVRFADINGPRGGADSECKIQIVLAGRPQLVVTERAADVRSAFDAACQAAGRAVKRDLERAGFTQGLKAARRHRGRATAPPAAEAPASEAPPTPTAKAPRRTNKYVPSAQKLGQRARAEANSPKTRASAAKARR